MGVSHIAHFKNICGCETMLWYEKEFNMMSLSLLNGAAVLVPVYTRLKASYRFDNLALLRWIDAKCATTAACM